MLVNWICSDLKKKSLVTPPLENGVSHKGKTLSLPRYN